MRAATVAVVSLDSGFMSVPKNTLVDAHRRARSEASVAFELGNPTDLDITLAPTAQDASNAIGGEMPFVASHDELGGVRTQGRNDALPNLAVLGKKDRDLAWTPVSQRMGPSDDLFQECHRGI